MGSTKNKKNLLVTLADENFVEQAKQLFSSVYWNAGWKGDYLLLAYEIPEEKLKWFKEKGILIKNCPPIPDIQKIRDTKWPLTVFSKFYLFSLEFKKWEHIIFLDADIIVRASLDKLTEVKAFASPKIRGFCLKKFFFCPPDKKDLYEKLIKDYPLTGDAFNTGVMAFNTEVIKKDIFSNLIELTRLYNPLNFYAMEESMINLFFYKRWEKLPVLYNLYLSDLLCKYIYNMTPAKIKGIIIHFAKYKEYKPWNKNSPFYKEWKNNLEKADLINLNQRPPAKEAWSEMDIIFYTAYLEMRHLVFYTFSQIDKLIGQFGLFLKKHWPKLYFRLKELKKNKR